MAPLATAYSGPPKLTLATAFTEWRLDVPMLVLILVTGVWYVLSARKVRRQGGQWGIGRTIAFFGLGLGFWVIATMSWVGVYQSALFYARATQTVLLVLVSPLFLMMGKPITLLIEAQPAVGNRVAAAIRSPAGQGRDVPRDHHRGAHRGADVDVLHLLVHGRLQQRDRPRADLPDPDGPRLRLLLDAAAGRPGAQAVPLRRGDVDHRGRGGRRRVLRHRDHRRHQT